MSYLEELLPEFRKGAKIRQVDWAKGTYIHIVDNGIFDQGYHTFELEVEDFNSPSWEFYEETDWQYIIAHKCFCWFWDAKYCKMCNILQKIDISTAGTKIYIDESNLRWNNCRPVRRDEVAFYEDRTNED